MSTEGLSEAVPLMVASTVCGLLDLRANAWITDVFLVLEVIAAAVIAFLGFANTHQSASVLVLPVVSDGLCRHTSVRPSPRRRHPNDITGSPFAFRPVPAIVHLPQRGDPLL